MPARTHPPVRHPQLLVEALEDRCTPATLTVLNSADAGAGSLRQALADAAPGDTVAFAPAVTGTIRLSSTLTIDESLTLTGPGRNRLAIDGLNTVRNFTVTNGANVTLSGLTIQNGHAGEAAGGGIFNDGGTLTVTDCAIRRNTADWGGGGLETTNGSATLNDCDIYDNAVTVFGFGGGIANSFNSTLEVNRCRIFNNSAHDGGGINSFNGLTVRATTITGNAVDGFGSGISFGGSADVSDTVIAGNVGESGSGIATGDGVLRAMRCTISGNVARGVAGAVINNFGDMTFEDCTIADNRAGHGGAIVNGNSLYATLTLSRCTLARNASESDAGGIANYDGTVTLVNTIVAENTAITGFPDVRGPVVSLGHNLIGNTSGASGFAASDRLNVSPLLGPLQDNGGPVPTMAVGFGSPALNGGDNANGGLSLSATDSRGRPRIAGGAIDIGAFETQPSVFQAGVESIWASTGSSPISVSVDQSTIAGYLTAVADITPNPAAAPEADIVFDLGGNTVTWPVARVPAGVTLTFVNGTFVGASPALTVIFGTVVVRNSTLTNATDAPTIRLVGGTLVLRDSVVQESTGYDQTAIRVEGGTLDLGTPADPGGNTINVNGVGQHLTNVGGSPATLYGNTWQENGVTQAGGTIESGQAAGIGFWANKNGRVLINALGTADDGVSRAGAWLATTFPNLFGDLMTSTPDEVWGYFKSLRAMTGGVKLEAQVMATALSAFVTDLSLNTSALGRSTAERYGFDLTAGALGFEAAFTTADQASALGLAGAEHYTVLQLLAAADSWAIDGRLFLAPLDATRRQVTNALFAFILGAGEIDG